MRPSSTSQLPSTQYDRRRARVGSSVRRWERRLVFFGAITTARVAADGSPSRALASIALERASPSPTTASGTAARDRDVMGEIDG